MSFLSRGFTGVPETRTLHKLESIPRWSEESMHSSDSGVAMRQVAFFSCVRILANSVSSLPLHAYRKRDDVRVAVSPQPKLIQSPYPGMTLHNWLWIMMQSLVVTGNAFGYITARDEANRPTAIMPIHPDSIQIDPESDWTDPIYKIGDKSYSSNDIFHVKAYPTAGSAVSLSPIEMAASTIDLSAAAEKYGLRWFRDSANPSGVLSTEAEITDAQAKQAMKRWLQTHNNRRLPAVLGGGFKWQSISITPNESQFLETRAHQRSDIAMLMGIPPHMLGDTEKSTSWGSGIEQQSIGFVVYSLTPWLVCFEQALDRCLPNGQFAKFNVDALLRGDIKARNEAFQIAIQNGWISPNEVRAKQDMPPIPNGDVYLQPMNFVPLGYEPPQPNNPAPTNGNGEEGSQ